MRQAEQVAQPQCHAVKHDDAAACGFGRAQGAGRFERLFPCEPARPALRLMPAYAFFDLGVFGEPCLPGMSAAGHGGDERFFDSYVRLVKSIGNGQRQRAFPASAPARYEDGAGAKGLQVEPLVQHETVSCRLLRQKTRRRTYARILQRLVLLLRPLRAWLSISPHRPQSRCLRVMLHLAGSRRRGRSLPC